VSTYNRAPFVEENVGWLLKVLRKFPKDIRLTVVDNASTDDTLDRLAKFARNPRLTVISNPVNLGMLGNLRACASLVQARHVWITGDDDFIVPAGLAEIFDGLKAHPEIPFAVVNFGVYRRSTLDPGDTAKRLIAEHMPLSARVAPSGIYPVRRIAEQHDNLFTAFYPIVFRSDLLAACFNYPFDGKPFADLVESVPTTKMLLETYAETDAYWCAQIGTVGNVANSWSRHLPRWHAVLMPRIFQLARNVGVDPSKLRAWSALHFELFGQAKRIAEQKGEDLNIEASELDTADRVFLQRLSLA
jgi:glycosyltransferase involved in cell wall biosynthesis